MKRLAIFLFSAAMFLTGCLYPVTANAEEITCGYVEVEHLDVNQNGIVDQEDICFIETSIINGQPSPFCVIDLISAYQILFDENISEIPVTKRILYQAEDPEVDCRPTIRNFITSDYPRKLSMSGNTVTITFLMWEGKHELIFPRSFRPYDSQQILATVYAESFSVVVLNDYTAQVVYN